MQCRNVRELADSFLSEELLTETNHEILRHLATCPACRQDIASRRELLASVRTAFDRADDLNPSPAFVAHLHSTLRAAALEAPQRRRGVPRGWWALAATVLLAVGLGIAFLTRGGSTAAWVLARAAVGDHRNCALQFRLAEKPIPLEDAARRYDSAFRVLESLPADDVATVAGPAHVLERHSCVYGGRRFAHIVLEYRGTRVSLLVTANGGASQITIPEEARSSLTGGRIDSMSLVSVRATRHMIFLVGDLAQADLAHLADAIAVPLSRQLAGA
jgi:anti-sigma factor RsiW